MNHPHLFFCHVDANNTACLTHKFAESITVPSTATAKVKDTASFHRLRYHCTTSVIPDGIEGASAKMLPDWVHRKVLTTHLRGEQTPMQVAGWVEENREGKLCAVGSFIWLVFPCAQGESYHTWSWFLLSFCTQDCKCNIGQANPDWHSPSHRQCFLAGRGLRWGLWFWEKWSLLQNMETQNGSVQVLQTDLYVFLMHWIFVQPAEPVEIKPHVKIPWDIMVKVGYMGYISITD